MREVKVNYVEGRPVYKDRREYRERFEMPYIKRMKIKLRELYFRKR